jgi:putative colanic acid biosynthesis acetyltransferase WcaF
MSKTTQLDTFNNSHFKTGAPVLKRVFWYIVNTLFFKSFIHSYALKSFFLRLFGAKVGNGVLIKPHVNIKYPWKLEIGNHVWIGEEVWIDNLDYVKIGDNVCISQGALLLCGNHSFTSTQFDLMTGPIVLEEGVWIGAKSLVGPNVTCGSHSVLSVMSVASKNLEPYKIYRGNPAQVVKDRIIK